MDYKEQIETLKNLEAIAYGYNINGEVLGMDCSDFEQIMVDAAESITDLLARAEAAEAGAEKAERERDAAVLIVKKLRVYKCDFCKHKKDLVGGEKCIKCKRELNGMDNWEFESKEE